MTAGRLLSVLAEFGPLFVGAVLLFAGLTKAIEPQSFVRHLKNLRLLPADLLLPAALLLIAFQCGLGTALMLRLWPAEILPAAILSLLALAALGYWGTATGRTGDCGCYNGLITLSPLQSLLLDTGYVALLGLAWWRGSPVPGPGPWRIAAALFAPAAGALLAYGLWRYSAKHHKPLFELTPMKVGHRWDPRWLGGEAGLSVVTGEKLVVFLGANCPHCKPWIKVLNTVHRLANLPQVVGAVALPPDRLAKYLTRESIHFPVVTVKPWQEVRLAGGVTPTAVVVKDGVIQEKWVRAMPKPFLDRLRTEMPRAAGPTVHPAAAVLS